MSPAGYSGLPIMASHTSPPDFLVGSRGNIFSGQASVFRGVPLLGKNRIDGLEAVVITCGLPRTVWTPFPSSSVTHGSFPFVTFATYPPDLLVRPRTNIFGGQACVSRGVPFLRKNWIDGLEAVVFTNDFPRTVWTPSPSSSVIEGSFPFVTFATCPPDLPVRPRANILGGQASVPGGVPLFS